MIGPHVHQESGELAASEQEFRSTTLRDQPVQDGRDIFAAQTPANCDGQCLATVSVDHGQGAKAAAVGQLACHEIWTPDFVGLSWHDLLSTGRQASCVPSAALNAAAVTLQRTADTSSSFSKVPACVLEQQLNASISVANAALRNLVHPLAQRRLRIFDAAVVPGATRLPDQSPAAF